MCCGGSLRGRPRRLSTATWAGCSRSISAGLSLSTEIVSLLHLEGFQTRLDYFEGTFEGFQTRLDYFEGTFIGTLEGFAVSVATNENELGLLQILRDRGGHGTVARGGDGY